MRLSTGNTSVAFAHVARAAGIACSFLFAAASRAQLEVRLIEGLNGGSYVHAYAVSRDGQVAVGLAHNAAFNEAYAFGWSQTAGTRNLGRLGPVLNSQAMGVSADGRTVVGWSVLEPSTGHAFRWTAETGMVDLGLLPGPGYRTTIASHVSADGRVVVGTATIQPPGTQRFFRWTPETGLVDIGPPPSRYSTILRVSDDGDEMLVAAGRNFDVQDRLFRWTPAAGLVEIAIVAPPETPARITAAARDGTLTGYIRFGPDDVRVFRWKTTGPDAGLRILDTFGRPATPDGISDDGEVVTGSYVPEGVNYSVPFLWTSRGGAVDMIERFAALGADLGGRTPRWNLGVSGDGRSVFGEALFPGLFSFVATFTCDADRTLDGIVDSSDYLWFAQDFEAGTPAADFNHDGFVDFFDYDAFVAAFEAGC